MIVKGTIQTVEELLGAPGQGYINHNSFGKLLVELAGGLFVKS